MPLRYYAAPVSSSQSVVTGMVTNVKAARKGQDRSEKIQLSGWSQGQAASLKEGAGGRSATRSRVRALLMVFQLSFSVVLLSGGGLLFQTLRHYQSLV